jgi:hypothetical protein
MISKIVENIPNQFVSFQNYGLVEADKEATKVSEIEKWAIGIY